MRLGSDCIPRAVAALIVGAAVASTVADWQALLAIGGWFALFGRFLAVAATLAVAFVAAGLALGLLVLPLIVIARVAGAEPLEPGAGERLAALPSRLRRRALAMADPVWKAAWWTWWWLARRR